MSNANVTLDTKLRKLPYSCVTRLCGKLSVGSAWERFATEIPNDLSQDSLAIDNEDFEPRYSLEHLARFKQTPNPPRKIFDDWATQNPTVKHLIAVLKRAKLDGIVQCVREIMPNNLDGAASNTCASNESNASSYESSNDPPTFIGPPVVSPEYENLQDSRYDKIYGRKEFGQEKESPDSKGDVSCDNNMASDIMKSLPSLAIYGEKASMTDKDIPSDQQPTAACGPEGVMEKMNNTPGTVNVTLEKLQFITKDFDDRTVDEGGRLIGTGGFGNVYLGIFYNVNEPQKEAGKVAIKRLRKDDKTIITDVDKNFVTELKYLSEYRHHNLVSLFGFCVEKGEQCLIYEYMPNGSLEERLTRKSNEKALSVSQRVKIVKGTARGIVFLNEKDVVHRDIKSANVLLDYDFTPKVGDFATARAGPSGSTGTMKETTLVIGTPAYLAPEALNYDISAKLDSFSFGIILLEILTGLPVIDNDRAEHVLRSHVEENCDHISEMLDTTAGAWPTKTVDILYEVAQKCYELSKKRRKTLSDVIDKIESISD